MMQALSNPWWWSEQKKPRLVNLFYSGWVGSHRVGVWPGKQDSGCTITDTTIHLGRVHTVLLSTHTHTPTETTPPPPPSPPPPTSSGEAVNNSQWIFFFFFFLHNLAHDRPPTQLLQRASLPGASCAVYLPSLGDQSNTERGWGVGGG